MKVGGHGSVTDCYEAANLQTHDRIFLAEQGQQLLSSGHWAAVGRVKPTPDSSNAVKFVSNPALRCGLMLKIPEIMLTNAPGQGPHLNPGSQEARPC